MSNHKEGQMSFGARVLWILSRAVAITPRWFQYGCLGSIIYFVMRYIVRYRRKLIIAQLTTSLPEKSEQEIAAICNQYYRFLAQTIVGTVTLAGMSRKERLEVLEVTLSDEVKRIVEGRDFVYWHHTSTSGSIHNSQHSDLRDIRLYLPTTHSQIASSMNYYSTSA